MSASRDYLKLCQLDPQFVSRQLDTSKPPNDVNIIAAYVADWNRDVAKADRDLKTEISKSIVNLLPNGVAGDTLPPEVETLLHRYAVADTLALNLQGQLQSASRAVLILACGGLICFELAHWFTHLHSELPRWAAMLMMFAFFAAWFVAIYLEHLAHRDRIQERYQDYRTLAEGLRVQFYWLWAGSKATAVEAYPKRQCEELIWLHLALGQWIPLVERAGTDPKSVLSAWITNQHDYFLGKDGQSGEVAKNRRLNDQYRNFGRFSLRAGIGLGFLAGLVMLVGIYLHVDEIVSQIESVLLFLVGLGIVMAATSYAWRERFAYAEHVKNYSAMAKIYSQARSRMDEGRDQAETILVDLGHEALSESTEWLMLHRERQTTEARL